MCGQAPRRAVGSWIASGRIASLLLLIAALGGLLYIATAPRFTVRDDRGRWRAGDEVERRSPSWPARAANRSGWSIRGRSSSG